MFVVAGMILTTATGLEIFGGAEVITTGGRAAITGKFVTGFTAGSELFFLSGFTFATGAVCFTGDGGALVTAERVGMVAAFVFKTTGSEIFSGGIGFKPGLGETSAESISFGATGV